MITKSTRPQSVMFMYQHCCEPAPDLHILNPYRFVTCVLTCNVCNDETDTGMLATLSFIVNTSFGCLCVHCS